MTRVALLFVLVACGSKDDKSGGKDKDHDGGKVASCHVASAPSCLEYRDGNLRDAVSR